MTEYPNQKTPTEIVMEELRRAHRVADAIREGRDITSGRYDEMDSTQIKADAKVEALQHVAALIQFEEANPTD